MLTRWYVISIRYRLTRHYIVSWFDCRSTLIDIPIIVYVMWLSIFSNSYYDWFVLLYMYILCSTKSLVLFKLVECGWIAIICTPLMHHLVATRNLVSVARLVMILWILCIISEYDMFRLSVYVVTRLTKWCSMRIAKPRTCWFHMTRISLAFSKVILSVWVLVVCFVCFGSNRIWMIN